MKPVQPARIRRTMKSVATGKINPGLASARVGKLVGIQRWGERWHVSETPFQIEGLDSEEAETLNWLALTHRVARK